VNDIESRIRDLLNESVDAELGARRPAPPFDPRRADTRARRWAPWVMPLVAAAGVAAVVGGTVAVAHLASDHRPAPPATSVAPTPTTPTAAPPSTTDPTSTPPSPTTAPSSTAVRSSVQTDWFTRTDVEAMAHPELNCPASFTPATTVLSTTTVTASGEAAPLGVAVIACNGPTGGWPHRVEIFRYASRGPVLVQLLPEPTDKGLIFVLNLTTSQDQIVVAASGHSAHTDQATPDLPFRQTFTWSSSAGQFTGGAAVDTLSACTGDQLSVTATPLSSQSGDAVGLRLIFRNTTDTACTLRGYPGASAVDAHDAVLADAKRTPTGFLGGLPSASGAPPTVTLTQAEPASAVIEWDAASYNGSSCVSADHFLTTAPNTTATQPVGANHIGLVCAPTVHPVVPGLTGQA
jgi:hypothetical protein